MALNLKSIQQHKEELGYDGNPNNSLLVEKVGLKTFMFGPLTSKYYVVSFEQDGLLFMGCNITYAWTNSNFFIPIYKVGNLSLEKAHMINGRLLFNAHKFILSELDGDSSTFIAYDYIVGKSWLKKNINNIKQTISSYPSMEERYRLANSNTTNASSQPNSLDQIAKLKQLLDADAITREEFDEKKKELLDRF
ncbi:SHOCT domain-containing protein [Lactobacillus taiwanensis]|uniref:SHOCT domain-containing protein n=1 Tax=Lactobacillus taiwanensis TaxID=508451 RepID=UPI000B9838AE|nr:SHOCT domain-containing protein [Lactobacillus taiwanensis]OYR95081.1 hypothetical protein CBF51_08905 [Lactobacillus taiwanensis]OYS02524.1 hypothetical protein CBF61_02520 [Lactobacillus taiwanensis]OYS16243.1 hypothetical protein CBF69_02700 [Lactobacillus taiwanensis]OYS16269.1 hypothetical protein CBF69_02855 [Lactobacillus taiwanensis]OYS32376.1 hypothetical protein CBF85_10710 [Lactobacillus taiwanensis]